MEPNKEKILAAYPEEEFLFADGFDEAILGVNQEMIVVYSIPKIIDILCRDMEYLDAVEHFDFNIGGAYVGEKTPIYVFTLDGLSNS